MAQQIELDELMSQDEYTGQHAKIMSLFKSRQGQWVPLPDILALGVAQYNARILELRRLGEQISNKTEVVNGQKHSWFMWQGRSY